MKAALLHQRERDKERKKENSPKSPSVVVKVTQEGSGK